LIDVADEVPLAAVEGLLELFQLGAPALDPILPELNVGLELCFAQFQVTLEAPDLRRASVRRVIRNRLRPPLDGSRVMLFLARGDDFAAASEAACSAEISTRSTRGLGMLNS